MSVCVVCRFKNERHIMYEWIHHYLLEDVDCIILIDHNSEDNYFIKNKKWMKPLIKNGKIVILKSKSNVQYEDYNYHLKFIKKFKWMICCDIDEFFFSVPKGSTIKDMLNNELSKYEYIKIYWKLFTHNSKFQPKSVINDNIFTHYENVDKSSKSMGIKCIAKTNKLKKIDIHRIEFYDKVNKLNLFNAHNRLIQNNHYRTQSDEYLYGVKEVRGGGVNKDKYKNFKRHYEYEYNYKCDLLKEKRKDLINEILNLKQIRPKIYKESSFYKEVILPQKNKINPI